MSDDHEDEHPLSLREVRQLRALLKSEERATWLWSTTRIWATWIAAIGLGLTVGADMLKKLLKSMLE